MATTTTIRAIGQDDLDRVSRICYTAFTSFNQRHGFPPEFHHQDVVTGLIGMIFSAPTVKGFVAESDGRVIGSNFFWDGTIGGVGPITVDSECQDKGVGRKLMQAVLDESDRRQRVGIRLVQAAFNGRSLTLYSRLGFDVREPLVCLQGQPIRSRVNGLEVRKMTEADIDPCCTLCTEIHGHDRRNDLPMGLAQGSAMVVQRGGAIVGYCTDIGFFGHAVAQDDTVLMALIGAAERISGPGFLLPMRNGRVFRWCLENGLRFVQPMTLMSRGLYNQPRGAFIPSILF